MYLSCTICALRGTERDEIEETFRLAPAFGFRHWGFGGPFTMFPGLMQWLDVDKVKQHMASVGLESLTEVWSPPIPTETPEQAALGAKHVAMAAAVAVQFDCSSTGHHCGYRALSRGTSGHRSIHSPFSRQNL